MNILVSRCLLGEPCRWHGKKLSKSSFVRKYEQEHPEDILIPVCPEVLGGLTVPRPPVKRKKGRVFTTCENKEERKNVTGEDVTDFFIKGAEETLSICKENKCKKAILCLWSPSCDKNGVTGKLLTKHGIEIINTF